MPLDEACDHFRSQEMTAMGSSICRYFGVLVKSIIVIPGLDMLLLCHVAIVSSLPMTLDSGYNI